MPGIDLAAFAERIRTLNAPDQGMNYRGAHSGERRYNEFDGKEYYTRGEPATLTVYGDRAQLLYDLIRNCAEIADALAALSTPVAQGDEVRDALRSAISNVPLSEPEQIGDTGRYGAAVLTTKQTDDVLAAVLKALSPLMERLASAEREPLSDDRPLTNEDAVFISIGDLRAVRATLTKGARDAG